MGKRGGWGRQARIDNDAGELPPGAPLPFFLAFLQGGCAICRILVTLISIPHLDDVRYFDISKIMEISIDSTAVVRALAALAQEHRLAAFRLLVQAGESGLAAGAIADAMGMAPSSMSFHLSQLTHAGLVTQRRQSRSIIYAADYAMMAGVMGFLTENCCGGVPCIADANCTPGTPAAPNTKDFVRNARKAQEDCHD